MFPALFVGCTFSGAICWLHAFTRYLLVACFLALFVGCMFSGTVCWFDFFPRYLLVACFPALFVGCMFSLASYWLHVFPRYLMVTCFSGLFVGCMFSRAIYGLHVYPRYSSVIYSFPKLLEMPTLLPLTWNHIISKTHYFFYNRYIHIFTSFINRLKSTKCTRIMFCQKRYKWFTTNIKC